MATKLPQQQGSWLMPVVPRNLHTKYLLNMTEETKLLRFHPGFHGN